MSAKKTDSDPSVTSTAATRPAEDTRKADLRPEGDDFGLIRQMLAQGDEEPGKIRERWSTKLRDRREKSDKALRRQREEFTKHERTAREAFLKKLKVARENFMKSSGKSGKTKEFYEEQEAQRQDFFNDEKDARKDFESQATDERKAFESYVTEKTNQFNQELKDYTASFYERKTKKNAEKQTVEKARGTSAKPSSSGNPELDEFKQMQKIPSTPLAPPDEK